MADFSFAPDPSLGWGGRSNMGSALYSAMTHGLGLQKMFEDQQFNSAMNDARLHMMPYMTRDAISGFNSDWAQNRADQYGRNFALGAVMNMGGTDPNTVMGAPGYEDYGIYAGYGHPDVYTNFFTPHPAGGMPTAPVMPQVDFNTALRNSQFNDDNWGLPPSTFAATGG